MTGKTSVDVGFGEVLHQMEEQRIAQRGNALKL